MFGSQTDFNGKKERFERFLLCVLTFIWRFGRIYASFSRRVRILFNQYRFISVLQQKELQNGVVEKVIPDSQDVDMAKEGEERANNENDPKGINGQAEMVSS